MTCLRAVPSQREIRARILWRNIRDPQRIFWPQLSALLAFQSKSWESWLAYTRCVVRVYNSFASPGLYIDTHTDGIGRDWACIGGGFSKEMTAKEFLSISGSRDETQKRIQAQPSVYGKEESVVQGGSPSSSYTSAHFSQPNQIEAAAAASRVCYRTGKFTRKKLVKPD